MFLISKLKNDNLVEILDKMKGIIFPGIVLMVRYIRLYSLDFICKNSSSSNNIVNFSALFFAQIKQLIKLYNMKRYTIRGKRMYEETVTYTVEANTELEAIEMVENGEVDDNDDHWQREISGGEDLEAIKEEEI